MKFRTLLLLGFTATACLASAGCIIESSNGNGNSGCLTNQFFNVTWEVDRVTMFSCGATPPSHVVLTTNNGLLLEVGKQCIEGGVCTDGVTPCNWSGSTDDHIPIGTSIVTASLISDVDGTLLSSASAPQVPIQACSSVELSFLFPI